LEVAQTGIRLRKLRLTLKSVCLHFEGGQSLRGIEVSN
jgi:hypothetical protein